MTARLRQKTFLFWRSQTCRPHLISARADGYVATKLLCRLICNQPE